MSALAILTRSLVHFSSGSKSLVRNDLKMTLKCTILAQVLYSPDLTTKWSGKWVTIRIMWVTAEDDCEGNSVWRIAGHVSRVTYKVELFHLQAPGHKTELSIVSTDCTHDGIHSTPASPSPYWAGMPVAGNRTARGDGIARDCMRPKRLRYRYAFQLRCHVTHPTWPSNDLQMAQYSLKFYTRPTSPPHDRLQCRILNISGTYYNDKYSVLFYCSLEQSSEWTT